MSTLISSTARDRIIARLPSRVTSTALLARRELREAIRSRWFVLYAFALAILGLGIAWVSSAAAGGAGLAGFGRTTAGLINLVLLIVPLMGLTAGAGSIASDRERGMLPYLLAQPIARAELLLAKFIGIGGALFACICLGLGASAAVLSLRGGAAGASGLLWLAMLSLFLALAMLSLGLLISVLARRVSVAIGTAVFVWLVLVFVTDLGLMAGTVALQLRIEELFALSLFNPLQVFKMWSLHAVDTSLDVLGPAGLYATEEFGRRLGAIFAGALAGWVIIPLAVAALTFRRRSVV